jgi:hypothetical protein
MSSASKIFRLSLICLLIQLFFQSAQPVSAQIKPLNQTGNTKVQAKVGAFYLSVSGYISPYASLSLLSDGTIYQATVADDKGYFSLSKMLINRGFSNFCIDAVDWKRLGESYTCFSFDPATKDIAMQDVFLPPTLGLYSNEIPAGGDAEFYGFSMPNAQVTVNLGNGKVVMLKADSIGYYRSVLKKVAQGSYELYAGAYYEGKSSLLPAKKLALKVLALGFYWLKLIGQAGNWLISLGPLLLIPSLLFLICIVVFVIWHERILLYLHLRRKKLHHAWFMGY